MDRTKIVFVVYNPPSSEFPYLSVIFIPGKEEPMVTQFARQQKKQSSSTNEWQRKCLD